MLGRRSVAGLDALLQRRHVVLRRREVGDDVIGLAVERELWSAVTHL